MYTWPLRLTAHYPSLFDVGYLKCHHNNKRSEFSRFQFEPALVWVSILILFVSRTSLDFFVPRSRVYAMDDMCRQDIFCKLNTNYDFRKKNLITSDSLLLDHYKAFYKLKVTSSENFKAENRLMHGSLFSRTYFIFFSQGHFFETSCFKVPKFFSVFTSSPGDQAEMTARTHLALDLTLF